MQMSEVEEDGVEVSGTCGVEEQFGLEMGADGVEMEADLEAIASSAVLEGVLGVGADESETPVVRSEPVQTIEAMFRMPFRVDGLDAAVDSALLRLRHVIGREHPPATGDGPIAEIDVAFADVLNTGQPESLAVLCAEVERISADDGLSRGRGPLQPSEYPAAIITGALSRMNTLCTLQQLAFSLEPYPALAARWALATLARIAPETAHTIIQSSGTSSSSSPLQTILGVRAVLEPGSEAEQEAVEANTAPVVRYVEQHARERLRATSDALVRSLGDAPAVQATLQDAALVDLVQLAQAVTKQNA